MPRLVDRIRAVAFDLDGTLVDSAPDLTAAANAMLAGMGHAALPQTRIESMIGEGVDRLVGRALAAAAGSPVADDVLADAIRAFRIHYARHLFERGRLYAGVLDGLQALAARGVALCVVTNKAAAFARPLLGAAGLADMFRLVLCAERPEDRKPSPNLLIAASAQLGVRPDELLYVGDSRIDEATARAAGCPFALVDYGYDGGRPSGSADYSISKFAEILALADRRSVMC